jgi:hypothetical protein
MTFEDALLDKAQKDIENTEKLCSDQHAKKFSFKKAFGMSKNDKHDKHDKQVKSLFNYKKSFLLIRIYSFIEWRK